LAVRDRPQLAELIVGHRAHEKERMQASDEERFTLKHVADTGRDLLIKQEFGKRGRVGRASPAVRNHHIEVNVVVTQVGAEAIRWRRA
jgi:hypothetical protein